MGRDMESRYGRRICDGDMRWGYGEKGYGKVMICEKKSPGNLLDCRGRFGPNRG